ncbi:MAG: hypothetical protein OXC80_11035 [Gammaproteobacteria bacterium]|nr:hypothetical protein [Gammaproteobacteria bacterium]
MAFKEKPLGSRFLLNRKAELFPDGVVSGSVLVTNIAFGAAALGAGHVEIKNENSWWFAASESNWLAKGLTDDHSEETLFLQALDFPELSSQSIRPEIYVSTFADRAYLDLDGRFIHLFGEEPTNPLPHIDVTPPWCSYVLGFQLS